MATRRFSRRWRPRARGAKPDFSWYSTFFQNSAVDFTAATVLELVLFDPQVILSAAQQELNEVLHLKRTIFNGGVTRTALTTAVQQTTGALVWGVYIIDRDDTDAGLTITTPGSILNSNRVIQTGVEVMMLNEIPTAQMGDTFEPSFPIKFDVRTNMVLRQDQVLVLSIEYANSIAAVTSASAVWGLARTLVRDP